MITPRQFIAWIGAILIVVGVILGFVGMSATMPIGESSADCGSAFAPSDIVHHDFVTGENSNAVCADALGGRRTLSLVLIGVGVVALVGAAVVRTKSDEPSAG